MKLIYCPYLDELADKLSEIEERFIIKFSDKLRLYDNLFDEVKFNLTPFQKSVYDAIDDSTVDDIGKSLLVFKTPNSTKNNLKK